MEKYVYLIIDLETQDVIGAMSSMSEALTAIQEEDPEHDYKIHITEQEDYAIVDDLTSREKLIVEQFKVNILY